MKYRVIIFCAICCTILTSCKVKSNKIFDNLGKDCMVFNDSIEYYQHLTTLENEIDSLQIAREKLKFDISNPCIINRNLNYEEYNDSLQKELNKINQQIYTCRNDLKNLSNLKFTKKKF